LVNYAARVSQLTTEALRALSRAKSPEAIATALAMLPEADPRAREELWKRYLLLSADPRRRDPGCLLRAALVRGLRGRALPADAAPLEAALRTYEFTLPSTETAGGLRAAALLVLSELDERLAGFHAVRLLGDPHTSPMSGEPAATAARLLAGQGQALILYQRLLGPEVAAEVAAACLPGLQEAPPSVLAALAEQHRTSNDPVLLLALTDLLLQHAEAERLAPTLGAVIEKSADLDVVRYAAAAVVAGRKPSLIAMLRARATLPGPRGELVREALTLLP
jgi:hypothetical protein